MMVTATAVNEFIARRKRSVSNICFRTFAKIRRLPSEVWIENTNICNASCVMCPREKLTRKTGFMTLSLYEKIIKEISRFPNEVQRVHLHNYGEPLLDNMLVERIRIAKESGIKQLYFVTNASALVPELSEKIIRSGLDEFKVSFYGTDKATYENTMRGLDFDKTIRNIREFFRIRKMLNADKPRVIIQYVPQESNGAQVSEFTNIFQPLIDHSLGDRLSVFSLHDFGGGRDYCDARLKRISRICRYPWRTMVILHEGTVALCCFDFDGKQTTGNMQESTIEEIWNNKRYRQTREDFKKLNYRDYPVCLKCNYIR
ncbi:MAG: radical SAM/SPASM domain-containing protein [Candidatus Omnitrophota bacterium]